MGPVSIGVLVQRKTDGDTPSTIEGAKMSFAVLSILGPMPSSPVAFAMYNLLINSDTCAMDINGISKRMAFAILLLMNSFNNNEDLTL